MEQQSKTDGIAELDKAPAPCSGKPQDADKPEAAVEETGFEEFDLDDIEVVESKVFA